MTQETRLCAALRLGAIALCAALLSATTIARAEPPADASKKEPAKSGDKDAKKSDAGQPAAVQPAQPDAHAGHDHGAQPPAPVQPSGPVVGPTTVRPPDVPAPTVVNKPGEIPKVKFETPIYDFGKIRAGEDIRKDFVFTNTGNGKLEILKVRPSCGCTTAGDHDKIVDPGKTGKIPIKVGTTNFSGPITKTVTVSTNCDGADSSITLQIKGEVWQVVQVTPNNASFGRVTTESAKDGSLVRKLTIVNNSDKKGEFKVESSSSPTFKGELKELEPGKKFELTVTLAGALSSGMTSGTIEISTGLADMAKVSVPVNAFLTADVDVTPNRLTLPTGRTTPLQRNFYVQNNSPKPLKISDLSVSNTKLKASLTEPKPGTQFRITLDIPADYKVAEKGDTLTFKTDNSSTPTISIPISEINYGANSAMPIANSNTPTPAKVVGKPGETKPAAPPAKPASGMSGH
jgi:hypothetical protein